MQTQLKLEAWIPAAATRSGPAHTWIRSWTSDRDPLRADVTAGGWQWHSVEWVDRDAAVLDAVFDFFVQRQRRQRQRNTPGEPHVLLALGPDVPWHLRELRLIAFQGRAVDVHLAVSAAYLHSAGRHTYHPIEFRDNIYGWYPGHSTPEAAS